MHYSTVDIFPTLFISMLWERVLQMTSTRSRPSPGGFAGCLKLPSRQKEWMLLLVTIRILCFFSFYFYTCMSVCVHVHKSVSVSGDQKRTSKSDPLELELTGSYELPPMGSGTWTSSSERTASIANSWPIFSTNRCFGFVFHNYIPVLKQFEQDPPSGASAQSWLHN